MSPTFKPRLAITMGDVNGVGPEILARALARPEVWEWCQPVVYGCPRVFARAARTEPGCPRPRALCSAAERGAPEGQVLVCDGGYPAPEVRPGEIDPAAGRCAVEWARAATLDAMAGIVDGLVTCPISKACIYEAGYHYTGHTELVAELTESPDYRMCLFAGNLRVVHITSHMALRKAITAVTKDRIVSSARIADQALKRMGIAAPRIAVAGLNPHAGENGAFGREEITRVAPAVAACCALGLDCTGPVPPDTVFRRMREGEFDVVIALYHDQGHIPVKLVAMDEGVNVTLGIPIVRTSVDHGTAFDIAWQGKARENSLCAAIELAARLAGLPAAQPGEPA